MARDSFVDPALIGRTIAGKFAIESYLGGGAMGAVYRAKQLALDKTIAIKVMHREMAKDEKFVARFKHEAKAASKLDHPNSLRMIDFGEEPDGLLYLAMEFVDGKDLFTVLKEGWPLANERIVSIMTQALAALAVAHDQGIVHRDLKPENIMVLPGTDDEGNTRDIVKVCDFGIAKITERVDKRSTDSARLSTKGLVVGTPEYMSPEQGRGESLDSRSDLYSMGVLLFQLLTRKVPFDAETAIGIVLKHVTEEPPLPSSIYSNVDTKLEAICLKALQKKREDRYQTAREMRADLKTSINPAATSVAISARSRLDSSPDSHAMEQAATLPIDLRSVTATARERTSSVLTPSGTEAFDEPPAGVPHRWTGYAMALALIGLVVGGGYGVWRYTQKSAHASQPQENTRVDTAPTQSTPVSQATAPSTSPIATAPIPSTAPSSSVTHSITEPITTRSAPIIPVATTTSAPSATATQPVAVATTTATHAVVVEPPPPSKGTPYVRIGTPKNVTGDVDPHVLRGALLGASAQINTCYANGLRGGDKSQAYTADMQIRLGTNSTATMGIPDFLTKSAQCILTEASHALATLTQNGSAEVPIEFVPGS